MWLVGGYGDDGKRKNDIWYSRDGISWERDTASAPFPARNDHALAAYDNKMWLVGGIGAGAVFYNDVWMMD